MSIRKKMILIFLACTIVPMCFVGLLGYFHARKTLETVRMEKLKIIADLKARRIEDFFDDLQKHLTIARQRPMVVKHTAVLAEFSGEFSDPIYTDSRTKLDRALQIYLPVYDVKDVILAKPEGKIVYVLNRSPARNQIGSSIKDRESGVGRNLLV